MQRPVLRQLVEEVSFAEAKQGLQPDAKRLDAILEAVTVRLAAAADGGTPVPGTDLYSVVTDEFPDAPSLFVLYRFDDQRVYEVWVGLY